MPPLYGRSLQMPPLYGQQGGTCNKTGASPKAMLKTQAAQRHSQEGGCYGQPGSLFRGHDAAELKQPFKDLHRC